MAHNETPSNKKGTTMSNTVESTVVPNETPEELTETQTPWFKNPVFMTVAAIAGAAAVVTGVALARRNGVDVDAAEAVKDALHAAVEN